MPQWPIHCFLGNILTAFPDSFGVELTKMGFALSVAVSFPMVIFPCRTAINSCLFARKVRILHYSFRHFYILYVFYFLHPMGCSFILYLLFDVIGWWIIYWHCKKLHTPRKIRFYYYMRCSVYAFHCYSNTRHWIGSRNCRFNYWNCNMHFISRQHVYSTC